MKLLTYNSLRSYGKNVTLGYPLGIEIEEMEVDETDLDVDFIRNILPTLDWNGILTGAAAVGFDGLPATFDVKHLDDHDFLKVIHKLLLDVHVVKGKLICPETGRIYQITDGIPRMNISEDDA
jgi:multifunctional methyltransferase subunit TRM112